MALVNGPLFSLDASGQLAKALVFSKWKGRNYVREYVTPANPNTLPQRVRRVMLGYLAERWSGISTTDKDSWNSAAAAKNISPFNEMISANLDRQTNDLAPSWNLNTAGSTPALTTIFSPSSPGPGLIAIGAQSSMPLSAGEVLVVTLAQGAAGASETMKQTIGFQSTVGQNGIQIDLSSMAAGDYLVNAVVVDDYGPVGTWGTEASVTVAA